MKRERKKLIFNRCGQPTVPAGKTEAPTSNVSSAATHKMEKIKTQRKTRQIQS